VHLENVGAGTGEVVEVIGGRGFSGLTGFRAASVGPTALQPQASAHRTIDTDSLPRKVMMSWRFSH
jgi:hypothetical protein